MKKPDQNRSGLPECSCEEADQEFTEMVSSGLYEPSVAGDKSPEEIKRELGKDHRYWHFPPKMGWRASICLMIMSRSGMRIMSA